MTKFRIAFQHSRGYVRPDEIVEARYMQVSGGAVQFFEGSAGHCQGLLAAYSLAAIVSVVAEDSGATLQSERDQ